MIKKNDVLPRQRVTTGEVNSSIQRQPPDTKGAEKELWIISLKD